MTRAERKKQNGMSLATCLKSQSDSDSKASCPSIVDRLESKFLPLTKTNEEYAPCLQCADEVTMFIRLRDCIF